MNPIVLLAIGGIALMALGGRKKGNGNGGAEKDTTGTIPKTDPGGAPPAESAEQSEIEQAAINIVLDAAARGEVPMIAGPLGEQAALEGVLGLDADTFAYPTPDEWLSGWLTRYAYWFSYPLGIFEGPFQLPLSCILAETCPAEYIPYRNALIRIHEAILAGLHNQGIQDLRFDADTGAFG